MGIDIEVARFIIRSAKRGVKFDKTVSIGRQNLLVGRRELESLLKEYGLKHDAIPSQEEFRIGRPFAESLFQILGATQPEALDASDYEGASLIHDLNLPLPQALEGGFDSVCELGSLEHVFNFTFAIKNCLKLVKKDGYFLWVTPANNFFGHGFYQFSPELLYRILSRENGFVVEEMVAVEYGPRRRWYSVVDPASIGDRVRLINQFPVMLMVRAKRVDDVEPLLMSPQQSDYTVIWENHAESASSPRVRSRLRRIKDFLIENLPRFARMTQALQGSGWNYVFSFRNARAFKAMEKRGF